MFIRWKGFFMYYIMALPYHCCSNRRIKGGTLAGLACSPLLYKNILYICTFVLMFYTFAPTILHIFSIGNKSTHDFGSDPSNQHCPQGIVPEDTHHKSPRSDQIHDPMLDINGYRDRKLAERHSIPLIFVGGMPRSGTTLMRAILDAHPGVVCGEETRVIPRILFMRKNWSMAKFESHRLREARITEQVLDSAVGEFILAILTERNADSNQIPSPLDGREEGYGDTNYAVSEPNINDVNLKEGDDGNKEILDPKSSRNYQDPRYRGGGGEGTHNLQPLPYEEEASFKINREEEVGGDSNDATTTTSVAYVIKERRKRKKMNEKGAGKRGSPNAAKLPKKLDDPNPRRLCNKDPFVMKTADVVGRIFPRAKFIFMIRDGRAVVQSVVSRKVTITGWNVQDYKQSLTMWNNGISQMYDICLTLGPARCKVVYYERLVLSPRTLIPEILKFLELPWNPRVLKHSEMVGKPDGISLSKLERSSDQVIKPINTQALYNWVHKFPPDIFEQAAQLAPMLKRLNYSTKGRPYYGEPDLMVQENDKWIEDNPEVYEEKIQNLGQQRLQL